MCRLSLLALAGIVAASAATAEDQTVVLDPFQVSTTGDKSYGALNSNSLTNFNAELKKLPISDDVMTKEFMDDVAATGVNALVSTYGVASGQSAVSSDGGATTMVGDRDLANSGNGGPTARGLTGGGTRLNGFPIKGGGGQTFDVERAEIIQGPQGLLYGAAGAGGVINTILNRARFGSTFGSVKYQGDEFGTKYGMVDANWGTDRIAIRTDFQDASQAFNRYNLGGPINGAYGQLAIRLLDNTVLRFSVESVTNTQTRNASVNFNAPKTGTLAADPRNAIPLRVLVGSGQAGDLDNGHVNFGTMDSFAGDFATERIWTTNYEASIETRETPWLSTQVAGMWDQFWQENFSASTTGLTPPGYSTNPTGEWAIGYTPSAGTQLWRRKAARASALIEFSFLRDTAHSQTIVGVDYWYAENTNKGDAYYQADANGNILLNPALVTVNNPLGRTTLSAPMWVSVNNGPLRYPLGIKPFANHYTNVATGVNYVRAPQDFIGTTAATATNPLGYTGPSGDWYQFGHSGAGYAAEFIDWFNGKLTTLAGVRVEDETIGRRGPQLNPATYLVSKRPLSANIGANFQLLPWLRPYVSYSNATSVPNVLNADPVGNLPKTPSGQAEEAGLKFTTPDNRLSGTLSVFNGTNKNDQYQIQSAIFNAINPNGGNGTVQPSTVWSTVNRQAQGASMEITAQPVDGWRSRLALSTVNSTTETTRNYSQYYNDQFYVNGGGVTWSDGSPYLVPVTPSNKTGPQTQLTLAMLNGTDANTNYVATLDPDSGLITNRTSVFPVTTDPVHGTVFTGKNGLPIADIQLNWKDPNGHHGVIPVVYKGEASPNFAKYQITWTNAYDFRHGPLRGLTVGGSFLGRFRTIGYYYNQVVFNSSNVAVGTKRLPFYLPDTVRIDPFIRYQHKLGRFTYVMQLNITNLLNDYHWQLFPNPASGAYNYSATYSQMPRMYTWSSSLKF